jgi:hypothetical protein
MYHKYVLAGRYGEKIYYSQLLKAQDRNREKIILHLDKTSGRRRLENMSILLPIKSCSSSSGFESQLRMFYNKVDEFETKEDIESDVFVELL